MMRLMISVLARAFAQGFDAPALGFGIARVHAKQVAGEDGRLIAAGAGTDFQENVAVILRILGDEQALQLEFLSGDAGPKFSDFLFAHGLSGGILVRCQLLCNAQIAFESREVPVAFDQRAQSRVLHRQLTELVLTPNDTRVREQPADFLESFVQFFELAPDGVFHGRGL